MVNYHFFEKRVIDTPHYRGSPNRYPLVSRSQTRYYFLKNEEGGQTVFDVCYDYRWQSRTVNAEEAAIAQKQNKIVHQNGNEMFIYERSYNPLMRVRADNSIEFIKEEYHQGDRMFLDKTNNGVFFNDSRRGGVVYTDRHRKHERTLMLPIFQGLKVTPDMEPITDFTVTLLSVDRKKSKTLSKEYEHFFKVSETMLLGMTDKNIFAQTVRDIVKDHYPHEWKPHAYETKKFAMSLMNTAPLDAFVLLACHHDIYAFRYMASEGKQATWRSFHFDTVFNTVKRHVVKDLYNANGDIFNERIYKAGEVYPQTDWGVTITVDGKTVEQCGYSAN